LLRSNFAVSVLIAFSVWADVADPSNAAPARGFETKEGIHCDDTGIEKWRDCAEADN
jgi:hypothetical protein